MLERGGLKMTDKSHPTRVRGLKSFNAHFSPDAPESHPTRVRGLKSLDWDQLLKVYRRTPRGCVD